MCGQDRWGTNTALLCKTARLLRHAGWAWSTCCHSHPSVSGKAHPQAQTSPLEHARKHCCAWGDLLSCTNDWTWHKACMQGSYKPAPLERTRCHMSSIPACHCPRQLLSTTRLLGACMYFCLCAPSCCVLDDCMLSICQLAYICKGLQVPYGRESPDKGAFRTCARILLSVI